MLLYSTCFPFYGAKTFASAEDKVKNDSVMFWGKMQRVKTMYNNLIFIAANHGGEENNILTDFWDYKRRTYNYPKAFNCSSHKDLKVFYLGG